MSNKTLKETMLHSETGKMLFEWITSIYDDCKIMIQVYEALGVQFDNVNYMFEDILKQMFPQTATWGLELWERRLNLPTNESENMENRRGKVIAKIQSKVTVNPETMAIITKNFTGADIKIIEWLKDWTFAVQTDAKNMNKAFEIHKIIKRIKPSHMAYVLQFILQQDANMYIGACTYVGLVQTILPYDLSPIEVEVNTYAGGTYTHIVKRVSIN
ncbi:putative phage tail protein [Peptostreptococcus stomatis]|jgi:hypothetical protein|uniref:putative phage tail protein n=1 Tax=Peptostreptococcus stomatis TaxID=341694 RepID=UPI0024A7E566|nr:putative phage tail protein [Peptostreptococcus stomatis]